MFGPGELHGRRPVDVRVENDAGIRRHRVRYPRQHPDDQLRVVEVSRERQGRCRLRPPSGEGYGEDDEVTEKHCGRDAWPDTAGLRIGDHRGSDIDRRQSRQG